MKKYKILLVDDEPEHIENLFFLLEKEDFDIFLAVNGELAVNLSIELLPDIIIMDWDMPVLSGIDASIKIRENELTKNIPIIMATGKMLSLENLQTAFDAGVNDFITKPFNSFEVIARVKSMIRYYNNLKKTIGYEKKIAELEIKAISSELASAKIRFLQQDNFINKIIDKLKELEECSSEKGKHIIKQLNKEIFSHEKAFNWNEFETTFIKLNGEFINNLNTKHSNLTLKEKKLCIFLKMNMTLKEIATITMSSVDAVTKLQYRLKKKLNVTNKSLSEYINSL